MPAAWPMTAQVAMTRVEVNAVWVALMSLAYWFVAVETLSTVFDSLFEAARYPASAYPAALRVIFVFLLPVAWTTTTPTGPTRD